MDASRRQYRPRIGCPPQPGTAFLVPGEDTLPIGDEQTLDAQITTDGKQAVGVGQRLFGGWEFQIVRLKPPQFSHRGPAADSNGLSRSDVKLLSVITIVPARR